MLNEFPIVRKKLLSVVASLLACIIFTALLALQQWDTRIKICSAVTEPILTVARLPVICTRFLFNFCLLNEGSKAKTTTPIDGRSQRTGQS